MDRTNLACLTVQQLARLIARREVSPVEVTEAYLTRIDRLDPILGAYATVLPEEARRSAAEAEREITSGSLRGPLHGIPISLKDLFYTEGVRTSAGSLVLRDFVPDYDATVVRRLREAGAILLGKANLFEFALGPSTPYPYGVTRNPWGLDRITGFSSSGSGVAVSACLCAASVGTDTGGSIRLPAALCGTVGLKPTYGRVSCHGVLPLAWSMDTAGPLTRSVADAAILLNAVAGHDPLDPASADLPVPDYTAALGADLAGVRVGVPANFFLEYLDPEVEAATRAALATLRDLGVSLVDISIPDLDQAQRIASTTILSEAATFHREWLRDRPQEYGENARTRISMGSTFTATDYVAAQRDRLLLQRRFQEAMEGVDVLVTPTTPRPAPRVAEAAPRNDGPAAALTATDRLTRPFNLLGWPAIALPSGFSSEGLPISLQIAGKPFAEAMLFRVAHAYEQATEWHLRRPPDPPTA